MVVQDEASLGATDTFAVEQGAGGQVADDVDKDIIHEAGLLHFVSVHAVG